MRRAVLLICNEFRVFTAIAGETLETEKASIAMIIQVGAMTSGICALMSVLLHSYSQAAGAWLTEVI